MANISTAASVVTASITAPIGTALSLPIDALFGRYAPDRSWHAVFVLGSGIPGGVREEGGTHA